MEARHPRRTIGGWRVCAVHRAGRIQEDSIKVIAVLHPETLARDGGGGGIGDSIGREESAHARDASRAQIICDDLSRVAHPDRHVDRLASGRCGEIEHLLPWLGVECEDGEEARGVLQIKVSLHKLREVSECDFVSIDRERTVMPGEGKRFDASTRVDREDLLTGVGQGVWQDGEHGGKICNLQFAIRRIGGQIMSIYNLQYKT